MSLKKLLVIIFLLTKKNLKFFDNNLFVLVILFLFGFIIYLINRNFSKLYI